MWQAHQVGDDGAQRVAVTDHDRLAIPHLVSDSAGCLSRSQEHVSHGFTAWEGSRGRIVDYRVPFRLAAETRQGLSRPRSVIALGDGVVHAYRAGPPRAFGDDCGCLPCSGNGGGDDEVRFHICQLRCQGLRVSGTDLVEGMVRTTSEDSLRIGLSTPVSNEQKSRHGVTVLRPSPGTLPQGRLEGAPLG